MRRVLVLIVAIVSGCTHSVPSYISTSATREALAHGMNRVAIVSGPASFDDDGSVACRVGRVITLGGETTFSSYIADAIKSDLVRYNLYDELASDSITIELQNVDVSSKLGSTNWYIDANYLIGSKIIHINTIYNDRSSFLASRACNNIALYFPKAVAMHLQQLYSNIDFRTAIGEQEPHDTSAEQTRLRTLQELLNEGLITDQEYQQKRREILEGL